MPLSIKEQNWMKSLKTFIGSRAAAEEVLINGNQKLPQFLRKYFLDILLSSLQSGVVAGL